jgi:hypothetical protein
MSGVKCCNGVKDIMVNFGRFVSRIKCLILVGVKDETNFQLVGVKGEMGTVEGCEG